MYVMVWKSTEKRNASSSIFSNLEDLKLAIMQVTIGEMPDKILKWDGDWGCDVHTWMEFVE